MVKGTGFRARWPWAEIPALACPSCVTLGRLLALSEAPFLTVKCR